LLKDYLDYILIKLNDFLIYMSSDSSSTNTNSSAGNTYYNINFGEGGAGSSKTPDNNSRFNYFYY